MAYCRPCLMTLPLFLQVIESYRSFARPGAAAAAAATTAAGNPCAVAVTPPADADADAVAVQSETRTVEPAGAAAAAAVDAAPLPPVGVQTCARVLTLGTLWVRLWGSGAPGGAAGSLRPSAAAMLATIRESGYPAGDGDGAEVCSDGSVGWVRCDSSSSSSGGGTCGSSSSGGGTSGSSSDVVWKRRGPPFRALSDLSTSSCAVSSSMAGSGDGADSGSGGSVGHGRRGKAVGAAAGGVGGVGQMIDRQDGGGVCYDVAAEQDLQLQEQVRQQVLLLLAVLVCLAAVLLGLRAAPGAVDLSAWYSPAQPVVTGV